MRRLLTRGLGMLGALWTLLVLGVPAALHPCPAHATSVESSADHGGHGDHAAHHPTESALDTTADPEQKLPGCACIDCGCATAPLALGHATVVRLGAVTRPADTRAWSSRRSTPPVARAHRLPFANGPPALIS